MIHLSHPIQVEGEQCIKDRSVKTFRKPGNSRAFNPAAVLVHDSQDAVPAPLFLHSFESELFARGCANVKPAASQSAVRRFVRVHAARALCEANKDGADKFEDRGLSCLVGPSNQVQAWPESVETKLMPRAKVVNKNFLDPHL